MLEPDRRQAGGGAGYGARVPRGVRATEASCHCQAPGAEFIRGGAPQVRSAATRRTPSPGTGDRTAADASPVSGTDPRARVFDKIGVGISLACAVKCLSAPLLVGGGALFGTLAVISHNPVVLWGFIALAAPLALGRLIIPGIKQRDPAAAFGGLSGLALMVFGAVGHSGGHSHGHGEGAHRDSNHSGVVHSMNGDSVSDTIHIGHTAHSTGATNASIPASSNGTAVAVNSRRTRGTAADPICSPLNVSTQVLSASALRAATMRAPVAGGVEETGSERAGLSSVQRASGIPHLAYLSGGVLLGLSHVRRIRRDGRPR